VLADTAQSLAEQHGAEGGDETVAWAEAMMVTIQSHRRDAADEIRARLAPRLAALEATARRLVADMQFGFLLDRDRRLLSIGYLVAEGTLDSSCYDLLASEARLASFIAIAKGDIPPRHWFRLGRSIAPVGSSGALVSWSGSMFEYLMPSLVMRAAHGSLLEQTNSLIVRRQIAYAHSLDLPWGISESAYNARDLEFTYQYSNFGVPGLGLKRGLKDNRVIAPYATALAAMVDSAAAIANFGRLVAAGGRGIHGFYEALDYTPARVPAGASHVVVRAYMAHHQGMSIVAIANVVFDGVMRARFHDEPMVRATELLLQERSPRDIAIVRPRAEEVHGAEKLGDFADPPVRRIQSPHGAPLATHLLSNGRYAVMITAAGSGYSRWKDLAVTRWREDPTCDDWGSYIFLRDTETGDVWSAGFQPSGKEPDAYEAAFSEDRADIVRRDGTLTTTLEILVSPEDDAEVRRVTMVNGGTAAREIEITSCAEIVLAPPAADAAHPAFSKLFVQTEFVVSASALLATRRPRNPGEAPVWAAHLAVVEGLTVGDVEIETDRARFIGRGRTLRNALGLLGAAALSGTTGAVLDPVFALRRRVSLAPGATARIAFWTVVAPSRSTALDAVDRLQDASAFDRASTLAWTQAQVQLRHLGIRREEAALFQRLAGHVLYADPSLRSPTAVGAGQPALWASGISGDLPIVVVRIDETEELEIVHQMLRAQEYWRLKRLTVDLVILNERASSYVQDLQTGLETMVRTSQARHVSGDGVRGGVFVLRTDLVSAEARATLLSAARVVLLGRRGSLSKQLARLSLTTHDDAPRVAPRARISETTAVPTAALAAPALEFFNGLGGFGAEGREYVTILGPGQRTPAPWINVVANEGFGFQAAAEGGGYSWAANSRENQITPWSNDPVGDRSGEAIYLRDRDSGALWTATANPIREDAATYVAHHGHGYCRFEHTAHQIAVELLQLVPLDAPLKISRLTIRNLSKRARRLSVTAYVEWILGAHRSVTAAHVITERDDETGAVLARNPWSTAFGPGVAFLAMTGRQRSSTGDRREFIGRNGTLGSPSALAGDARLSGHHGSRLDPCGALQTHVELAPNASTEIVVLLGQGASVEAARALIARFGAADIDAVLRDVNAHWDEVLGTVQVRTPDRAMDLMLNGWLLYQTLACRVWARAGFYQASGAFGFRDQLQDGMALAIARPAYTRAHLLRAASRQFLEGDVQHWWLPHSGQGVRTRISDDVVWLAHATSHYVDVTGDHGVLDADVPFIDGPVLRPGEHDSFYAPTAGEISAPLFEHCARALDRSLAVGAHGLPLIGTGDWNDGMNRVGEDGRGESIWLGWFLHTTLTDFARHAEARGEAARAGAWRAHADALAFALEHAGWDGAWYRRGYFDDGTPLGAAASEQCRIDSIAQSWAVISGAGSRARAATAMASAQRMLVHEADRLALLFAPPFDAPHPDPGYVGAYPPGIRENGGQYTHAACWSVIAWAKLGEGDKAAALFALLNPINRTTTSGGVRRYKVEPYAIAADIYAQPPHVGRGGWTWYTGSSGWLYRAGLEAILGLKLEGETLRIDPCHAAGLARLLDPPALEARAATRSRSRTPWQGGHGVARITLDGVPWTPMAAASRSSTPRRPTRSTSSSADGRRARSAFDRTASHSVCRFGRGIHSWPRRRARAAGSGSMSAAPSRISC
jgi:cyclic beta-1,2-glucan synthetase